MEIINMHEAKTHLSKLVKKAAGGEPFIIAIAGKPMVKVIAVEEQTVSNFEGGRFGFLKGKYLVPDDFDTMGQAEIEEAFHVDA